MDQEDRQQHSSDIAAVSWEGEEWYGQQQADEIDRVQSREPVVPEADAVPGVGQGQPKPDIKKNMLTAT